MSDREALQAFFDKSQTEWPEWALAEVFVPVSQRELARAWLALRGEWADAAWAGVDPVSYTHLDVYKRQVLTDHAVAVSGGRIQAILPIAQARLQYAPKETVARPDACLLYTSRCV